MSAGLNQMKRGRGARERERRRFLSVLMYPLTESFFFFTCCDCDIADDGSILLGTKTWR